MRFEAAEMSKGSAVCDQVGDAQAPTNKMMSVHAKTDVSEGKRVVEEAGVWRILFSSVVRFPGKRRHPEPVEGCLGRLNRV